MTAMLKKIRSEIDRTHENIKKYYDKVNYKVLTAILARSIAKRELLNHKKDLALIERAEEMNAPYPTIVRFDPSEMGLHFVFIDKSNIEHHSTYHIDDTPKMADLARARVSFAENNEKYVPKNPMQVIRKPSEIKKFNRHNHHTTKNIIANCLYAPAINTI